MQPKFTIGDIVQLKSGGPDMTVSETASYNPFDGSKFPFNGTIYTVWFENGKQSGGNFHQDMLDKIDD